MTPLRRSYNDFWPGGQKSHPQECLFELYTWMEVRASDQKETRHSETAIFKGLSSNANGRKALLKNYLHTLLALGLCLLTLK